MAEAIATKYTPQDRLADGSIRITFPESSDEQLPKEYLRQQIAEFVHTLLMYDQYSQCEFVVCAGPYGNLSLRNNVDWCIPCDGMKAIPFWVKEVRVNDVCYPTRKYSLKPMQNGRVHKDTFDLIADYLESSKTAGSQSQVAKKVPTSVPMVFSIHFLQKFISACASEVKKLQKDYLSDAALVRIYQTIDPALKKTDIQQRVELLVERKFFTHTGTDLNEFYFGPSAQQYLSQFSGEFAQSEPSSVSNSNDVLAKAVRTKRRLTQELAQAQARVETAQAQCLTFESRITALEAELQKQPDIAQLVQEGVAAELQRLLLED